MLQPQIAETLTRSTKFIFVPTTEEEYERLVKLLDEVTDIVRDNEAHPLARIMDVLGVLIADYENEHIAEPEGDPITVLQYLMDEHGVAQNDLPELGSRRVVTDILNRKRALNLNQVKALSERFRVPASVFI
jgi:HTH-type transcriptional regulator/antitoxin HigA